MGARTPALDVHGDDFAWWLLDAAPDATIIASAAGAIVFANERAGELFGVPCRELLGHEVEDLLPAHLRAAHQVHRERYREEPRVRSMGVGMELRARRLGPADPAHPDEGDDEFPVEISLSPLVLGDEVYAMAAVRDISERIAADQELQRITHDLRDAEQARAVAEDRERIARDLHDTVVQRLFGEGLNLQATLASLQDEERTRRRIESTIDGLDQTIQDLRTAVFSLQRSASSSAPGGLRGRLLEVVTEATTNLGFEPRLQFDGAIETIPASIAEHLVPVLREALTNVARHAQARSARVSVVVDDAVTLTVTDDGVGVPDEVIGGRGTRNVTERARGLGGEATVSRRAGGGTALLWRVPLRASDPVG